MGYISFQREKMNNPITEGSIFRNDWIPLVRPLRLAKYDYLVCYCDPRSSPPPATTTRP